MPAVGVCPSPELLEQFLLGVISDPEAERLEEHLGWCSRCQETLWHLRAEDGVVRALREPDTAQHIPHRDLLEAILPLLKRMKPAGSTGTGSSPGDPGFSDAETLPPSEANYLAPPQDAEEIGELGSYRVLEVLGSGGMGKVFRAYDPRLKRHLALKVIRPDLAARPGIVERFLREAQSTAAIEHENIVTVYHSGEEHGVPFLAMPLLRGETLDKRLARANGPLPIDEVLRIGRETASGLAVAHQHGLIHRDIKPSNLFLEGSGCGEQG